MTDRELKELVERMAITQVEIQKAQKETDKQLNKIGKEIQELRESQKKTDEQLKRTDEELRNMFKKTDEQIKELKEAQKKTDEQLKKTDEQLRQTDEELRNMFKKVDERLDKVAKQLGGISNNQGDVAEEYFINSLKAKPQLAGIEFDYLIPNYQIVNKKFRDEFDILLVSDDSVAIVEVKYKVHPNDIDKLKNKVKNLKKLPQFKDYHIYAGVAGFNVTNDVIEKALERGYFILQRKGDVIQSYPKLLKVS